VSELIIDTDMLNYLIYVLSIAFEQYTYVYVQ